MRIISSTAFALSLISSMLFFWLMLERTTPRRLQFNIDDLKTETFQSESAGSQKPVGIIIERIGVWLPVYPATITNQSWDTTTKGVSFVTHSGIPGERGNAVFYGHNWPNLLARLPQVVPGDRIAVIFPDNSQKVFEVSTTQEVTPDDSSVLAESTDPILTLYTCSGFMDSKRFVVVAKPIQNLS